MKKRISFLLALIMAVNLFGVFITAGAEEAAAKPPVGINMPDGYELIDTAYSREYGYIVSAKDYAHYANTSLPMKLYNSKDGFVWTEVYSNGSSYNNVNKYSRQQLIWWEEAGMAIVAIGNGAVYSRDLKTWTALSGDNSSTVGVVRNNGPIESEGDTFISTASRTARIHKAEGFPKPNAWHYFKDTTVYAVSVGLTPADADGNRKFVSVASDSKYYIYSGEYESGEENSSYSDIVSLATGATVYAVDVKYVPGVDGWVIIFDNQRVYTLTVDGVAANYLFDKFNGANVTAAEAFGNTVIVGTSDGKLYSASAEKGINSDTVWTEIESENSKMTDEVRSITAASENEYLAVTKTKAYLISNYDGEYRYSDVTHTTLKMLDGADRIEVPLSGTVSQEYSFASEFMNGNCVNIDADKISLVSVPDGTEWNNATLTVSSECNGGEVIINAVMANGVVAEKRIAIVAEKEIVFEGKNEFIIPYADEEKHVISAYVNGTDGERMERSITYSAVSLPEGVTFDAETAVLTVSADSAGGEAVISAASDSNPNIAAERSFYFDKAYPRSVRITSGTESIDVPDSGTVYAEYTAEALNQADEAYPGVDVEWSLGADSPEGITIDSEGRLTVPETAYDGTAEIIASIHVSDDVTYTDSYLTKLNFSDKRSFEEDVRRISNWGFDSVSYNLTLPTVGKWGSTITWKSSDDSVITSKGVISPVKNDEKTATLSAEIKRPADDGSTFERSITYDVTVNRSNIVANGDIELGNTSGFGSEGNIEAVTRKIHTRNYALKSDGSAVSFEIGLEGGNLEKNSSYYIEAYVYAPLSKKITMKSDNFGTLSTVAAADGYVKVIGSVRTVKAVKDTITISVDNASVFMIDDVIGFNVTQEYDKIATAVSKAESTKTKTDVDAAKALLDGFYDCPAKDEFQKRLDAITIGGSTSNTTTKTSGGGGGPSVGSSPAISTVTVSQEESEAKVDYAKLIFKDMDGHWAKDDVEAMGAAGIISGRAEGVFDPEASVTRAEFAVLISRTMGLEAADYENTFFDVITDDWYSGYVQAARNAGYLTGSNGLFMPNNNITREEIARIVVSAYAAKKNMTIEQGGALYYGDIAEISSWAYDYVVNAVDLGFMQGMDEYSFAPKDTATRAQAAVILKRLLDKLAQ